MTRSFLPPRMPDTDEVASLKRMVDIRDSALEEVRVRCAKLELAMASALKAHARPQNSSDEAWWREHPRGCDSCTILREALN